jgi:hypothetical protein
MTCWQKPKWKSVLCIPVWIASLIGIPVIIFGGMALTVITIGAFRFECAYHCAGWFLDQIDRYTP